MVKIELKDMVNLTPHPVTLIKTNGDKVMVLKSKGVVRVQEESKVIGSVDRVAVIEKKLGEISEADMNLLTDTLANPRASVLVSLITARALRKVMLSKDLERVFIIGDLIRDNDNKIIGADALARACDLWGK